jgi:KUP system potassium uptake protein
MRTWEHLAGGRISENLDATRGMVLSQNTDCDRAIRISWLCFAYPCLLFAYIGQAAYISDNPSAYSNPFFDSTPPRLFWLAFIVSILATVVASQALITGTFQLISQVMNQSYFPKVKLVHTSAMFYGQVYIPSANWLLMIGTIVVTVVFNNVSHDRFHLEDNLVGLIYVSYL